MHVSLPGQMNGRPAAGGRARSELDGRTVEGRRYRDVVAGLAADLGRPPTEADRLAIRSAGAIVVAAERLQAEVLAGRSSDFAELGKLTRDAAVALATLRGTR